MNSSSYAPPMFSYSSDAFDNDFDIGLLSEYLLDEENPPQGHHNDRKQSFSKTDFSSFPHEEGIIIFTHFAADKENLVDIVTIYFCQN